MAMKQEERNMTILELGALGEFIASMAVVITLVFLTIQMRQNTQIVKANALQAWVSAANTPLAAVQNNDSTMVAVVDGLTGSADLNKYNWVQYGAWLQQMMYAAQATYFMHTAGAIPKDVYEAELDRAAEIVTMPSGKQWWEAGARSQFAAEFVKAINTRKPTGAYHSWGFTEGVGFHPLSFDNN
jgi:hypothetical protein